jgi:hypothetical protein
MNQLSSEGRTLVGIHIHSDKVRIIDVLIVTNGLNQCVQSVCI